MAGEAIRSLRELGSRRLRTHWGCASGPRGASERRDQDESKGEGDSAAHVAGIGMDAVAG